MSKNLLSAAVVIGALRAKRKMHEPFLLVLPVLFFLSLLSLSSFFPSRFLLGLYEASVARVVAVVVTLVALV